MSTWKKSARVVMVSSFCCAVAIATRAAADVALLDCSELKSKPALLLEAQTCVAEVNSPESRAELTSWVSQHRHVVMRSKIADAKFLKRVDALFGAAGSKGDPLIEITAPDATPWAKTSPKMAAAGGHSILGAGIALCTAGTVKGHFELTRDAVQQFRGWSTKKKPLFLPMAVVNVDDHAWRKPEAHAQSDALGPELKPQAVDAAVQRFEAWLGKYVAGMRSACKDLPASRDAAAYSLGVIIHATQDLSTHAGITNPEHAALMLSGNNPDGDDKRLARAQRWTIEVLTAVRAVVGDECIKAVTEREGVDHLDDAGEKAVGPVDARAPDYRDYVTSGFAYRKATAGGAKLHTAWFDSATEADADAFFKAHVLTQIK